MTDSSKSIASHQRSRNSTPVDVHIGQRVRLRRTMLGLSQESLAESLGLTFQQVQKYERGANRIGAGRLLEMANVLGVSISYFYDELTKSDSHSNSTVSLNGYDKNMKSLVKRETLELVRAYHRIENQTLRNKMLALAQSLANTLPTKDHA